jgi:hypothetical protein
MTVELGASGVVVSGSSSGGLGGSGGGSGSVESSSNHHNAIRPLPIDPSGSNNSSDILSININNNSTSNISKSKSSSIPSMPVTLPTTTPTPTTHTQSQASMPSTANSTLVSNDSFYDRNSNSTTRQCSDISSLPHFCITTNNADLGYLSARLHFSAKSYIDALSALTPTIVSAELVSGGKEGASWLLWCSCMFGCCSVAFELYLNYF